MLLRHCNYPAVRARKHRILAVVRVRVQSSLRSHLRRLVEAKIAVVLRRALPCIPATYWMISMAARQSAVTNLICSGPSTGQTRSFNFSGTVFRISPTPKVGASWPRVPIQIHMLAAHKPSSSHPRFVLSYGLRGTPDSAFRTQHALAQTPPSILRPIN